MAVFNFFPFQKLIFCHFCNCKKWNLVKRNFVNLIYLISRFFGLDIFKFSSSLCHVLTHGDRADFHIFVSVIRNSQKYKSTYYVTQYLEIPIAHDVICGSPLTINPNHILSGGEFFHCTRHLRDNLTRYVSKTIGCDGKLTNRITNSFFDPEIGLASSKTMKEFHQRQLKIPTSVFGQHVKHQKYMIDFIARVQRYVVEPRLRNKFVPIGNLYITQRTKT